MKFGGTSVADAERIKRPLGGLSRSASRASGSSRSCPPAARRPTSSSRWPRRSRRHPDPREMDMLLSTGERISCALCAMAINDLGHRAISLTGSQAGIVTDASHTKARIIDVRADRIREALTDDLIVLVAGFQGVSTSRDVTTLGRGGSDTTAVALAAAIGAEVCEIYTDVAGVFTADPRVVPSARKLPQVSFEEMLEMAASGAKVLQLRSVEYARTHGVRLHCRSSFDANPGTVVIGEDETMEHPLITAVTHSTEEARITLPGSPTVPARRRRSSGRSPTPTATSTRSSRTSRGRRAATRRCRSRSPPRTFAPPSARSSRSARSWGSPRSTPTRDRQGLDHRCRHALASRRGRPGVRDARRARTSTSR